AVARPGGGADVLNRAHDVVGHTVVGGDVVELAQRQHRRVPALAAVGRDVHAAVVAVDHAARIERIDPQVVMIDVVRPLHALERTAGVDALQEMQAGAVDDIGILRIDVDGGEVPRTYTKIARRVDEVPLLTAIVGAIETTLFRLDESVNAPPIRGRDREADA